jgi:hypothetical protein
MNETLPLYAAGAAVLAALLPRIRRQARWNCPAPSTARSPATRACRAAIARLLPFYAFDEAASSCGDDAAASAVARRAGLQRLAGCTASAIRARGR